MVKRTFVHSHILPAAAPGPWLHPIGRGERFTPGAMVGERRDPGLLQVCRA